MRLFIVRNIGSVLVGLCLSLCAFAQTTVTGKVINAADKKPVGFATVYLNNTMVATRTTDDGAFTLNNAKNGSYDMMVSFVGFETYHQNITIGGEAINLPAIQLHPKVNQLKEVKIGLDPNRDKYLEVFKRSFIGQSDLAKQCEILNLKAIDISYDTDTKTLNASSNDFLIIENKALGYTIKYQVDQFIKDYLNQRVYYAGPVFFEEMKGSPSQLKKWNKTRLDVYRGSDMHFLRSVFAGKVEEEGFIVLKQIRRPNPARPADSLIDVKLKKFSALSPAHPEWVDSLRLWRQNRDMPKAITFLGKKPLADSMYVKKTGNKDVLALSYPFYLYIIYPPKSNATRERTVTNAVMDVLNNPTSIVSLTGTQALFDRNGVFLDPASTNYEGVWARNKVAEMLPVDYTPGP